MSDHEAGQSADADHFGRFFDGNTETDDVANNRQTETADYESCCEGSDAVQDLPVDRNQEQSHKHIGALHQLLRDSEDLGRNGLVELEQIIEGEPSREVSDMSQPTGLRLVRCQSSSKEGDGGCDDPKDYPQELDGAGPHRGTIELRRISRDRHHIEVGDAGRRKENNEGKPSYRRKRALPAKDVFTSISIGTVTLLPAGCRERATAALPTDIAPLKR